MNLIRLQGPISKSKLSKVLNLSITAVAKYINILKELDAVIDEKSVGVNPGRKPALININPDYGYGVGIDFGQGTFKICLVNAKNQLLDFDSFPSNILGDYQFGKKIIVDRIHELMTKNPLVGNFLGIGIAISGIIDHNKGLCHIIPNLPGWENIDFRSFLTNEFHVPVFVDDSARTAALYQSAHKKGRDRNLIYVSIGIGIGMGIIMDWQLFRGESGFAGEIGHITVCPDGIQCGCGNKGCLEQYSSVPAMARRLKSFIDSGVNSVIKDYIGEDYSKIDGYTIRKALDEKDKLAYNIVLEAGHYLGVCLSQIVTLFNPSTIIIGGGGVKITPDIVDESIKAVKRFAISQNLNDVKITQAKPDSESALLGASLMMLDYHFDMLNSTKEFDYLKALFKIQA